MKNALDFCNLFNNSAIELGDTKFAKLFTMFCQAHNVRSVKKDTKHSSNTPKPSGKLRRLTPSFGCILAVRPKKKFFLGIKLFCFSR